MIDRVSGVPAYRQVAADLRGKISDGTYPAGSKLPSERTLIGEYGVSRITIREAIGLLRSEGLVVAEHGRGVFVRATESVVRLSRSRLSKAARDANQAYFLGDAAANSFTPTIQVTIRFEEASVEHAAVLDVPPGSELLVRERLMLADGQPVQLATSRLSRDLTRGTQAEEMDTGPGGIYSRLEDAGYRPSRYTELVKTRMPTREETTALQLGTGVPVLVVQRIAYDSNDRPVEVNEMTLTGDRYELLYEIPAD
ncbi:GntR family transcriptional regulator [Kribbella solani]|uniref:GntR family transcriptional regulator n=1 Tax=Kribbella solani TaxID=236067 RepID=UPI0029BEA38F|nr:GntR family transcriptional regulator [Kribbella solani]MDX3006752.1 GntR family transcriptional regulator [Kribbella solani]